MVNILLKYRDGDRLVVRTDYAPRPVFNYPFDKFDDIDDLRAEINASIAASEALSSAFDARVARLELDDRPVDDDPEEVAL